MEHLLKLSSLTPDEIIHILDVADEYKRLHKAGTDPKDLQGKAIALEEVKDEVFSQKILGDGIAVVPEKGELYAPADGVIESVFGTKHAISMKTNAGAELLMHIGMDTVKRDGKGFDPQVKDGETVKKGQLLMKFDLDGIKADGYDVTTPIVVTNADEFTIKTVAEGAVVPGAALLKLEANK